MTKSKKKLTALIFGISGQDGSYLADFLIKKNYKVVGTTRNNSKTNLKNLYKLQIFNKIKIIKCDIVNFNTVRKIIKTTKPNDIYYL